MLESRLMVRLIRNGPARSLRPARRALTGRVALAGGSTAGHESSLERDWLIALDFDWRVRRIQEQPYTLAYSIGGKKRRYTPDILAEFDDGTAQWAVVYEVKAHEDLRKNWVKYRPRFKVAVADCRRKGQRFRIITERHIRTPYVENVKFLRRYKHLGEQVMHRKALLYTLPALGETTPQALLAATWGDYERRMAALPELWRLIANRTVSAGLMDPLTMATPIWLA